MKNTLAECEQPYFFCLYTTRSVPNNRGGSAHVFAPI